jgi:hypothetical protein
METADHWFENNKQIKRILSIGTFLFPVALYFIPLNWLGKQPTICLYKIITGHNCYGCGMTRAVLSAMHFQFENAYHFNKLVIIVLPLLIYIWAKTAINLWKKSRNIKLK